MDSLVPVHIGLMGHIDHGKTALARAISEQVSTAGLDKHPQAKERGITIDLGFTMFVLDKFLVTLVDTFFLAQILVGGSPVVAITEWITVFAFLAWVGIVTVYILLEGGESKVAGR